MIKKSLYLISSISLLTASTTLCYKKEHLDPATIETVTLDGGECDGKSTVLDMKKNGYIVDSMKIQNGQDGLNYIYIFKKGISKTKANNFDLKTQINQIEKDKQNKKAIDEKQISIKNGEKLYQSTCKRCHGEKADKEAYNSARALNTLSLEDIEVSIRDYTFDEKDNGMAILMKPYADGLLSEDMSDIYNYIQILK